MFLKSCFIENKSQNVSCRKSELTNQNVFVKVLPIPVKKTLDERQFMSLCHLLVPICRIDEEHCDLKFIIVYGLCAEFLIWRLCESTSQMHQIF